MLQRNRPLRLEIAGNCMRVVFNKILLVSSIYCSQFCCFNFNIFSSFVCNRFQYVLAAATSIATKVTEETLTYLNQGQSYEIKLKKLGELSNYRGRVLKVIFLTWQTNINLFVRIFFLLMCSFLCLVAECNSNLLP